MSKKKEIKEDIKELKAKIIAGKGIIGTDRVIKALLANKLSTVYLSSNCPEQKSEEIFSKAKLADVLVIKLELSNEELGILCKKNFFVSVVGTI
ncbi:MAG: ribosomal L7Ae/L30e/S12e/Gadd45 family protein [Nanoarchaeota archaeon]|nr:ribosomal L7Ae/L30e/S12e/Gadd45 family protein [Nanoarchaeota archaeon]MBU1622860.1 ribosomal L7Ae/L30e/S12e/Gadd45 family protein [Nanoarchaeota archaeon]MBU1974614.1 ribosomal L7Ae/L30e/S12e/Gadd45 family protein [Nanoarchaeota archaeon]